MHRDAGRWRHGGAFISLSFQKGSNGRRRCLFIIGLGAWEFLVWRRVFAQISPNFHEKFFVQLLSINYLPRRSWWGLFGVTSKKGLHVIFCKPWAPCFEVKQGWAPFSRGFSGMFPRFSANQNFWGCAWPPPPTSTTVFHNSIIGNFVVYQNRIET